MSSFITTYLTAKVYTKSLFRGYSLSPKRVWINVGSPLYIEEISNCQVEKGRMNLYILHFEMNQIITDVEGLREILLARDEDKDIIDSLIRR